MRMIEAAKVTIIMSLSGVGNPMAVTGGTLSVGIFAHVFFSFLYIKPFKGFLFAYF